ncbi:hypothetical protein PZF67_004528 [Pseudomonas aeruginosa]|uniref:hypothetical protein n=1 Tax=Pseudomonas aeruginosa TaxID=287 RepID=UPI0025CB1AD5|nr:hypothetical protein [Pseudomonas aeruginosa]
MGDEFLVWSLVGLAWLILLPTVLIFIATWTVSKVVKTSFVTHAALGFIGVPIHELAHGLACLLFRMPITRMRLFSPNYEAGNLGYVSFAYNPRSTFHAVGLLVQGVAPLIAACLILGFLFPIPSEGVVYLGAAESNWLVRSTAEGINQGLSLTLGNLVLGMEGAGWAILALLIAAYSIPSWSDVRIALRGAIVVAIILVAGCALLSIAGELAPLSLKGEVGLLEGYLKDALIDAIGAAIRGISMVVFVSLTGLVIIQVFPALIGHMIKTLMSASRETSDDEKGNCRPEGPANI